MQEENEVDVGLVTTLAVLRNTREYDRLFDLYGSIADSWLAAIIAFVHKLPHDQRVPERIYRWETLYADKETTMLLADILLNVDCIRDVFVEWNDFGRRYDLLFIYRL